MIDLSVPTLQKRLDDLGVRDIKVFWSESAKSKSRVDIEKELSFILNTYLDGYCKPLGPIGDGLLLKKVAI